MTHPVKWFSSTMGGAPVIRAVGGDFINVLDACLINGFNLQTANTLVVADEVATMAFPSVYGWLLHQVIEVAGATPSALNGQKRVLSVTGASITFAAPGVSDQTATGTITCKTPGIGWSKPFSATNKAAYRSSVVASTQHYLRVDDGVFGTQFVRTRGYESMSDVDTGTGPFPTDAQLSGGFYLGKSSTTDTGQTRAWFVVADAATLYAVINYNPAGFSTLIGFGDLIPFAAGDLWCSFLGGAVSAANHAPCGPLHDGNAFGLAYAPRSHDGTGASVGIRGSSSSADLDLPTPNPAGSTLILREPRFAYQQSVGLRGILPGVAELPHSAITSAAGTILGPADGLSGLYMLLPNSGANFTTSGRRSGFNLVGPWR